MVSVWKKSKVGVAGIAGRTGRPEIPNLLFGQDWGMGMH